MSDSVHRAIILLEVNILDFQHIPPFRTSERVRKDLGLNSRPNFALMTPPRVKFRGRVGEMFESLLRVQLKTKSLIHFCPGATRSIR